MLDDKTWQRALRAVAPRSNPGRGSRSNPQLQILGDIWGDAGTRRNGRRNVPPAPDLKAKNEPANLPRGMAPALRKFHGRSYGNEVAEANVAGINEDVELGYLADVTAVTFQPIVKKFERLAKPHKVLVDGNYVDLGDTIRVKFSSTNRPQLCLHLETNEAWIVGKAVESLHSYCDDRGVLGPTPCVEYAVDPTTMPKSSKNDEGDQEFDYLHEFVRPTVDEPEEADLRPVLVFNKWGALVFSKDRTPVAGAGAQRAVYVVEDWFHEAGFRYHDDE